MSKEIRNIVAAYEAACRHNKKTALATVVHVEGSSYRRPGARMLVDDDGKIIGAISGGCLEGDALRRALQVMHLNEKRLITYDTTREDDLEFGVQLGCNGIVHILFEPVEPANETNPVLLLKHCINRETEAVLVTLFNLEDPLSQEAGTCMFVDAPENVIGQVPNDALHNELLRAIPEAFQQRSSVKIEFAGKQLTAFIELITPPIALILVGAGNDALPVVEMALILGWQVTVVDGRSSHANLKRFPHVHRVLVGKPAEIMPKLRFHGNTAVVLMTHNFNYDLDFIQQLNGYSPGYLGCLGPRKRLNRVYNDLEARGVQPGDQLTGKIYGPAGLDIGAEMAEEIALSILAEVKAVFEKRAGGFLKNREVPIHENTAG